MFLCKIRLNANYIFTANNIKCNLEIINKILLTRCLRLVVYVWPAGRFDTLTKLFIHSFIQKYLLGSIKKWTQFWSGVFLWFVPLIWKRGDDIKLIAVARSIGIKNTNMFGKLFSFYGVSDDSIDIKLVEIEFAMTKVESLFNNFVV